MATQQVGTGARLRSPPGPRAAQQTPDPGGVDPRSPQAPQQPRKALAQGACKLLRPVPLGLKAFVSVSSPLVWTEVAPHSLLGSGRWDAVGTPLPAYSCWTPVGKCTGQGMGNGICLVTEPFVNLVMVVGPFSKNGQPGPPDPCILRGALCSLPDNVPTAYACTAFPPAGLWEGGRTCPRLSPGPQPCSELLCLEILTVC